ncbi:serine/threonine-protein kinase [Sphingobacterium sp. UBA6320]|uniref:serine/threonine-protein kinase n=1 Tax=Sphingobacterium sp. UBA6320 TaxID=1947510 RepID=UPI0025F20BB9|nr:serine/threonine-protein kinase [Sphingobacterium sp. UBA6320]
MFKENQLIQVQGTEYRLVKIKGEGGSGTVWTAESGGDKFAIKYIKTDKISTAKLSRFHAEIEFSKDANHRNILKLIAEGTHEETPFYVMPYYSKTLRQVINEEKDRDVLIKYILKICAAIKYIHRKGIKHRDIKPENILIDHNDLVLADFGIAHFNEKGYTKKGEWLANRNYMAPEQKLRNNALNITISADIYALGLIINECFTKQNPAGTRFKRIADTYPLLYELDTLVENMIMQEPTDRIDIDSVITQIKFIYQQLKKNLRFIKYDLELFGPPQKIKSNTLREIYKRASEDILFGKYLFDTHSSKELNRYNHNWHMKIGYTVSDFIYKLYVQEQILQECKLSFLKESGYYSENTSLQTRSLEENEKYELLYSKLSNIVKVYDLKREGYSVVDLTGQILKYFSSCSEYRCEKILGYLPDIEMRAKENLKNNPIIWIVSYLKDRIIENADALSNGINGLGGRFKFRFEDHILIDWDRTQHYDYNDDQEVLVYDYYIEKQEELKQILITFQQKWKITFSEIDEEHYSIKFNTFNQFKKFSEYALSISKPHYIFEGDVLDILREPKRVGNMVELILGKVFDIPTTVAQILGLKEVHA